MEGDRELLRQELTELHSFTRHHFQLFLNWFTFFLTVNFLGIGWFTSVMLTGSLKVSLPIIFIAAYFISQLVISYIASTEVRNQFEITHRRCQEILDLIAAPGEDARAKPRTVIPLKSYVKIIKLMCQTLICFACFWLALTLVAIYLVPL